MIDFWSTEKNNSCSFYWLPRLFAELQSSTYRWMLRTMFSPPPSDHPPPSPCRPSGPPTSSPPWPCQGGLLIWCWQLLQQHCGLSHLPAPWGWPSGPWRRSWRRPGTARPAGWCSIGSPSIWRIFCWWSCYDGRLLATYLRLAGSFPRGGNLAFSLSRPWAFSIASWPAEIVETSACCGSERTLRTSGYWAWGK